MPLELEHADPAIAADGAAAAPDVNESAMSRLRRRYEKLDDGEELFTIQTYGELLPDGSMAWPFVGRYRRLDPSEIRKLRREVAEQPEPELEFSQRLLVEACVELGVRGAGGELEPIAAEGTDPVRWDNRLVKGLGEDPIDAPGDLLGPMVLRLAFKGNLAGINEHSADVYGWMIFGRAVAADPEGTGKG